MEHTQPGILAPVPRMARYLMFALQSDADPRAALTDVRQVVDGNNVVVGLGKSLTLAVGVDITGLRTFPTYAAASVDLPSTPFSLWCWLRGADRGELVHQTRLMRSTLAGTLHLKHVVDAFQYGPSLDLTGYEDGTENPTGDDAVEAAIVKGAGAGMDGSSFVAVQQWVHDLDHFQAMSQEEQDSIIGRRQSDNQELDDAPVSAHVKRTAQESFQPEAFILRRSMPWADATREGLMFVAFGKSFDAFDMLLRRMVGGEDGVTDALFRFTRPITGSYFWCPPVAHGRLDLTTFGL